MEVFDVEEEFVVCIFGYWEEVNVLDYLEFFFLNFGIGWCVGIGFNCFFDDNV